MKPDRHARPVPSSFLACSGAVLVAACSAGPAPAEEVGLAGKGEFTTEVAPETLSGVDAVQWLAAFSLATTCPWDDPASLEAAGCNVDVSVDLDFALREVSWYLTHVVDVAELTVRDDDTGVSMLTSPPGEDSEIVEPEVEFALAERVGQALERGTALEIGRTPLAWWEEPGDVYDHPYIFPAAMPAEDAGPDVWAAHLALELEAGDDTATSIPLLVRIDIDMLQLWFDGAQTSLFAPEDLELEISWNPFKSAYKAYDDMVNNIAKGIKDRQRLRHTQVTRAQTQGQIKPPFGASTQPGGGGTRTPPSGLGPAVGRLRRQNYVAQRKKGADAARDHAWDRRKADNSLHKQVKSQGGTAKPLTGRGGGSSSKPGGTKKK